MSLRESMGALFNRANAWVWNRLPPSVRISSPGLSYGNFLNSRVRLRSQRTQYHGTFFFRNRPELELIRAISEKRPQGDSLKVAVLACSNGAEVYSIVRTIRSARPDLNLIVHAIDISSEIVEMARRGEYSVDIHQLVGSPIFERVTEEEIRTMFERDNGHMKIQPWLKEGINWQVGDAGDQELAAALGGQDIVVANKFLCHMAPPDAEKCLRSVAHFVAPGGYLFVSGIDLDVRTKVALDLGWTPIPDLLEEIHDGDPSVRRDWPWRYWGLEPLDRNRSDWKVRYASVFQVGRV